jgi:hypothetical protein
MTCSIVSRIAIGISSRNAQRTEDGQNEKKKQFHTLSIYGANCPVLCGIFPGNNTQIVALNKSRGVIRFRGRFIERLVSGDVHGDKVCRPALSGRLIPARCAAARMRFRVAIRLGSPKVAPRRFIYFAGTKREPFFRT